MKRKITILASCFALVSFTISTQSSLIENIKLKLNNYQTNNYPEKIYIQTDKPTYEVEETIWFTSYLLNGITLQKTDKSKVIHIDLINPHDSIVAKRNLYVDDISVAGDIEINKNWIPGNYRLRAYTNYMLNGKHEDFFYKNITINNQEKEAKLDKADKKSTTTESNSFIKKNSRPQISFYPEGGYLVNGIPNKITFKIKDNTHKNINLVGALMNQNNEEIIEINTLEFGLGAFLLSPKKDESYYVRIDINGKEERYPLPKAITKGYVLNVINNKNKIGVTINTNIENGLQGSFLVAHQRGLLLYSKDINTHRNKLEISTPIDELQDGVVNITLFNPQGNPVAERCLFVDNSNNNLKLSLNTKKESFKSREKVIINLNLTNNKELREASTLSMAVRDLKAFPYNSRTSNIKTHLLLNSDLRGKIENPGYFFEKDNDVKRAFLLDLVMMTNGWKRFTWQELLNNKATTNTYLPEQGLFISGTTKQLKKPYLPFSSPTRLSFLGKTITQEPVQQSDSLGKFKFGPFVFFDSIPVIIESRTDNFKSKNRKSRNVVILVDNKKTTPKVEKQTLIINDTQTEKNLNYAKVTKYINQVKFEYDQEVQQLETVELVAKKQTEKEKREEEMYNLTDYGEPFMGRRIDLLNNQNATSSLSAFEIISRMPSVRTAGDSVYIRHDRTPALIVIDGLEFDADFLHSIQGSEISFIDILIGSDAITFPNSPGGVIAIYSNIDNFSSISMTPPNDFDISFQNLQLQKLDG